MVYIQVLTAFEKKEDAKKLAYALLEKRLAGCVQILRVESIYKWKKKIEEADEFLCIIKTRKSLYRKVEKEIKECHTYEVPEIIVTSVNSGSRAYLGWLGEVTK